MAVGRRTWARVGGYALAWLLLAVPSAIAIFLNSSTTVTVASHDAEVQPTLHRYVTIRTGPFLPDVRRRTDGLIGVDVRLGKTEADSTEALVERYAFIASQPDSQIVIVEDAVKELAWDAAARGAVLAVFPLLLWALIGKQRRREVFGRTPRRRAVAAIATGTTIAATVVLVVKPWQSDDALIVDQSDWQSLASYLRVRRPGRGPWHRGAGHPGRRWHEAPGAQRGRHLSGEQGVLPGGTREGRAARPAPARGGRDRGADRLRPPRQHRDGRWPSDRRSC